MLHHDNIGPGQIWLHKQVLVLFCFSKVSHQWRHHGFSSGGSGSSPQNLPTYPPPHIVFLFVFRPLDFVNTPTT